MATRITIIDGHPDPSPDRFVHALAAAYEEGARDESLEVRSNTGRAAGPSACSKAARRAWSSPWACPPSSTGSTTAHTR